MNIEKVIELLQAVTSFVNVCSAAGYSEEFAKSTIANIVNTVYHNDGDDYCEFCMDDDDESTSVEDVLKVIMSNLQERM